MWKFILFAVCSLLWALKASEGFDGITKSSKIGCNSTLKTNTSGFELNFHNLSKPCFWNITPSTPGPVRLFFFNIFLHQDDNLNLYKSWDDIVNGNPLLEKPIPSQNGSFSIITNEDQVFLYLHGIDTSYQRVFQGVFSTRECSFAVKPDVKTLYPPIYIGNVSKEVECDYRFNEIPHLRVMQTFTFEEYNMNTSTINLEGSTLDGEYNNAPPTDFFIKGNLLTLKVRQAINSSDHFRLKIQDVDKNCSGLVEFTGNMQQLASPQDELNNGSISAYECRWLVQHNKGGILGLKFDKLNFASVFDIVAVNDGCSEISSPLLQVTTSNRNVTQNQVIRSTGSSLWISFKPLSYESNFVVNVTVHGQGGYFKNNGNFVMKDTTGDDTAFLLEVQDNEVVMLNFDDSSITPPATVSIYDGFDTSNLITSLHGQIKFPIFSRSSRMMVIGTKFSDSSNRFSAKFEGVMPGCNYTSSLSTESYILSENCNAACMWIIPPQIVSNSALIVYLQYISLKVGDNLKIHKLDASLTQLAEIGANEMFVPRISVPADVGIMINVLQASCNKSSDKIVLIGHSSYLPACNHNITLKTSEFLQISSPLYPDTYPVFINCQWNISTPKGSVVHTVFQNLNLAKNHCIKISQNSGEPKQYEGKTLPDDLFLNGDVLVNFDSFGCNKTEIDKSLSSDAGFLLNITVADCGAILDGKTSGEFNTSVTGNQSICIWKVSVPPTTGNSVNVVSYVVNEKNKLKNYELHVYDGKTVRDSEIVNNTADLKIWSRTNTVIFVYRRLDVLQPSAILAFKYDTITCDKQCDNKICMHPDWVCDGINDCGDYSDEHNCNSTEPIPPEIKYTGYSATAFWLCILAMMLIGIILGVTVPVCYQRYKESRYRRFHELSDS